MQYREITKNDISALFSIRIATRENTLSIEELAQYGITPKSIAAALLEDVKGWLYETEDKIVGFAMGNKTTGEMLVIALLPNYEGLGIGKQLLTLVENWLFTKGHNELWLTTSPDPKIRSHGFYKKLGWVSTGVMQGNDEIFKKYKYSPHKIPTQISQQFVKQNNPSVSQRGRGHSKCPSKLT